MVVSESDVRYAKAIRVLSGQLQNAINDAEKAGLVVDLNPFKRTAFAIGDVTVIDVKIERRQTL